MSKEKNNPKDDNQEQPDPINKPEEVPESNDEKIDQDFPGYPHYPAKDDILNPENNTERIDVDVENITRSTNKVRFIERDEIQRPNSGEGEIAADENDEIGIVPGTEADVTEDDLLILEATDGTIGRNMEEELTATDNLKEIMADDLDLPGTEIDDNNEALGEEDEENNYYSLGADKEDILEDIND